MNFPTRIVFGKYCNRGSGWCGRDSGVAVAAVFLSGKPDAYLRMTIPHLYPGARSLQVHSLPYTIRMESTVF